MLFLGSKLEVAEGKGVDVDEGWFKKSTTNIF
jgi:hypothetical protein